MGQFLTLSLPLVVQSLSRVQPFCNPMDYSLTGSSVFGISQARILEWVASSFSRGFTRPRDQILIACIAGGFFTTEPPGMSFPYYALNSEQ